MADQYEDLLDADPSPDITRQILLSELEMYRNTRKQLRIRYKINKGISNEASLPDILKSLEDVEKAMVEIVEQIKEVDRSIPVVIIKEEL